MRSKIPKTANYSSVRIFKPCRQCREWFVNTKCGKYCTEICCYQYKEKHRKLRKRKNHGKKERGPFICQNCKVEYKTLRSEGEGEIYCSRDCAFAHKSINKKVPFTLIHFKQCSACNSAFITKYKNRIYCSEDCCRKTNNQNALSYAIKKHHREGKIHRCVVCDSPYCLLYGTKQMKYCSDECFKKSEVYRHQRKLHNIRKRMIVDDYEYFSPYEIFERDKWRCQACGRKTPWRLCGTYKDNAPELDHIIPLSKYGGHIRSNVRLCCRKCNSMKGNGSLNDQLLLIG